MLGEGEAVLIFPGLVLRTFLKLFRESSLRVAILDVDFEITVFVPNNHELLLTLKNFINHCFYLFLSSLWWHILIGRISVVSVAAVVEVVALGFLKL